MLGPQSAGHPQLEGEAIELTNVSNSRGQASLKAVSAPCRLYRPDFTRVLGLACESGVSLIVRRRRPLRVA